MTSVATVSRPLTVHSPVWLLAAAVVSLEIPYPLVHGHAGDVLTIATVLAFCAASMLHALAGGRPAYPLMLALAAGVGGFVAEAVGVHTGVPFGDYRYTGGLGPSLLGLPVLVPLAWVMMAHPALVVARRLTRRATTRIVVAAWALASWDVFLDPQMVHAGHWQWADASPHLPGVAAVPITNFGGWLLVALVVMLLLVRAAEPARPYDDRPALVLWLWTWLSSTLANVAFFGRPGVAAWGFVAMGAVGVPLLARLAAARA